MAWLLIALGLLALAAGGELLVRGASDLAARLGVSPFVIGLTIVGFGTSSPELAAAVVAAWRGAGDIAVGNVVGSNIFNIAVILGITGLIAPIAVDRAAVKGELWWTGAAVLVPLLALTGVDGPSTIGRAIGVGLIVAMAAYLARAALAAKRDAAEAGMLREMADLGLSPTMQSPPKPAGPKPWVSVLLVIAGLAALIVGSSWLVDGAVTVARDLGLSELAIGLTIVAAGTSMPELVTSLLAAVRQRSELAVGNILGSNVFNAFAILGITALVRPQTVSGWTLSMDVPMTAAVTGLLAWACLGRAKIGRGVSAAFVIGYAAYLGVLLARG